MDRLENPAGFRRKVLKIERGIEDIKFNLIVGLARKPEQAVITLRE